MADAAQVMQPRDVILRDGTTVRLRAPLAGEADDLVGFFAGLSHTSLYRRFHGLPVVDRSLVEPFLAPDGRERGSLVASLDGRLVALASWTRLRDPARAEVAFAVADELQGHGLGTRLLEQLASDAGAAGVSEFVASVLPGNEAMLEVFRSAGFQVRASTAYGVVEVRFPITATAEYVRAVDRRDHEAVVASLRPFFAPASVAVVGASAREGTIGGELFRNVKAAGFAGAAYPVNRSGEAVDGEPGYTSVGALPETPELVVVCVPAAAVETVVRDALERGTRAVCVVSAGFAESGAEGRARQDRLLALVRAHGARMVGPNCLGLAMPGSGLNATFARTAFPPGRIGFSSQSGALGLAVLEAASARGIGLSAFVSLGNKADVSSNDLLEWWEDDAATDVVLLYVESFGNPRKFARVARRVALRKPVLALKAGRSRAGARAAGSHTAALAASDTAVAALFRQAGVTRADTLEELLDTAALLSSQPLPNGRAVAVLTNAGGLGILCADACEGLALALPALAEETRARLAGLLPGEASLANPVDMLGSATAATYGACLPVLLDDPGIDAVVVLFVPPAVADVGAVSEAIGAAAAGASKPVLACLLSAEIRRSAGPVPVFAFPESAPRALAKAVERAEWLRRPAGVVPALPDVDEDRAAGVVERALAAADDGWLDPAAARELLVAYGIPLVAERLATTADAAAAAARELGLPVVVKLAEAGVHKTERGGVALDLRSETAVREATARMDAPVLVQPMVGDGVELIAGLVQDASFGPLVVLGAGGVLAELIGEAGFRLAPLTDVDAEELVLDGKVGRLVRGFRGTPPRDAGALVELLLRLGRLGHDRPEVAELDLNPVMALSRGCVAVDARVRVAVPERRATAKTW